VENIPTIVNPGKFMANRINRAKSTKAVNIPVKKKSKLSFIWESLEELKKARWPTKREAFRLSILVMVICVVVGGILGVLDYGFTKVLTELILGG
jgi:preprotein translocase SecE subunit